MIRVNRDQFLEQGYLILRGVIQPQDLEVLRRSYENLVDRQREIWSEEAARGVATADVWQSSPQPRLNITRTPDLGDRETSPVFEFWLRENIQGVSQCSPRRRRRAADGNDAHVQSREGPRSRPVAP